MANYIEETIVMRYDTTTGNIMMDYKGRIPHNAVVSAMCKFIAAIVNKQFVKLSQDPEFKPKSIDDEINKESRR